MNSGPLPQLLDILEDQGILPALAELAPAWQDCFLVGGGIRDWLLGRPVADFDFATAGDPTSLAREFAARVAGRWVSLDENFCQSRVVWRGEDGPLCCDFAPLRAATIAADLAARDFTINAMAFDLRRPEFGLYDPLGGADDLASRTLRLCSTEVLSADPLRILRAVRFATTLGMVLDDQVVGETGQVSHRLNEVAGERINAELSKIFEIPDGGIGPELLLRLGIWQALFDARPPAFDPSFLGEVDSRLSAAKGLDDLLRAPAAGGWSCGAVTRFALFLRLLGPRASVPDIARRLRWGQALQQLVSRLCDFELPENFAALVRFATTRGRVQACLDLGKEPACFLLFAWLLDPDRAPAPDMIVDLLGEVRLHAPDGRLQPLVDGAWITSELGIPAGPQLGQLLEAVRLGEVKGEIGSRLDAELLLRRLAAKTD